MAFFDPKHMDGEVIVGVNVVAKGKITILREDGEHEGDYCALRIEGERLPDGGDIALLLLFSDEAADYIGLRGEP